MIDDHRSNDRWIPMECFGVRSVLEENTGSSRLRALSGMKNSLQKWILYRI